MLLATPGGRRKLALALGIPLLLVAVVLMFLPANESPGSRNLRRSAGCEPALRPNHPDTAAPLPETDASQIADIIPEVIENCLLPKRHRQPCPACPIRRSLPRFPMNPRQPPTRRPRSGRQPRSADSPVRSTRRATHPSHATCRNARHTRRNG